MFFFLIFVYIYWFLRERERDREYASGRRAERGDTESEAGSRLWAVSTEPDAGLELTNCKIMTWAEVGCLTDWAIQVPLYFFFLSLCIYFERERQSMNGGRSERGRHRMWNRPQALSCQHRAQCGARTHELQDHDLSWSRPLNQLSPPGIPPLLSF